MKKIEIDNSLELNIDNKKTEFLNSTLYKTINKGIDIGLRYILPDLVEDEVIDVKDNLIKYGLKDGIKKSIEEFVQTGKETAQVLTGNYENITELQSAIKSGGMIDKLSDSLDIVIEKVEDSGKINNTIGKAIKKGKNSILSSVEKNIESTLMDQANSAKYVEKYIENWKEYYNNKDIEGMQKEYNNIQKEMNDLIPMENTIKNAEYIKNIHNLIKNKGGDFNLTEDEIALAKNISL